MGVGVGGAERGWAPHHRRGNGSKRAGPIKRSSGCNCSTYSQQILIYGRAIKARTKSLLRTSIYHNYIHRASVKSPRFSVQHSGRCAGLNIHAKANTTHIEYMFVLAKTERW